MYSVIVKHSQDLAFEVTSGDEQFVIDAKGSGLTPLSALLASLGSCIGVYIRKYSEGAKLNLTNFKIKLEAELTQSAPFYFKKINVSLDLGDINLDQRRINALLEFIKHCPVHNTLENNPIIEVKVQ